MRSYHPFDPLVGELDGAQVIEASAGTGKTYNLTFMVLRLVIERELPVEQILVVTFARLATAELRDAVRARLRQAHDALEGQPVEDEQVSAYVEQLEGAERARARRLVRRALGDFDQAAIFSIHGFCQRMLGRNAFESGVPFALELIDDQRALCLELASDFFARRVYGAPEPFVDYLVEEAGLGRDGLANLVQLAADKPDVEFLFGQCADERVEPELQTAFGAARERWLADRQRLHDLLGGLADDGVLKASYKGAKLRKLTTGIDGFLRPARVRSVRDDGGLSRLTPAGLAEGIYAGKRKKHRPPEEPFFDAAAALVEQLVRAREAYRQRANLLRRELVEYTRRELELRKRERRIQSFNDQLHDLDRALADPSGGPRLATEIRRRFAAALIDEFQDTNPVQYRIFSRLFKDGDTPFFTIGDPKQAIYAFRGGDIFTYLEAVRESDREPLTLDVNWRADHRLIRGVSTLFERVDDPFISAEIGFPRIGPRPRAKDVDVLQIDGESPPPLQLLLDDEDGEAGGEEGDEYARVAADIAGLLDAEAYLAPPEDQREPRRISAGDVAVLLTANYQAPRLQAALRERGITSVVTSDGSVFATAEAVELERLLAAVAEPGNGALVRAALATDLIGLRAGEIWRMQDDDRAWERWIDRLRGWRSLWEQRGIIQLVRAVMAGSAAPGEPPNQARILGLVDGERRMTNFGHLAELLHRQANDDHLGCGGLLRWLAAQRGGGGTTAESAELRLESDAQAVKLLTVYKAKGLQFPVVYLPFMKRGKVFAAGADSVAYHDPDQGLRPRIDLASEQIEAHREIAAAEELAERLRVLYVALTRAQHLCRVVWGRFKGYEHSALGYLLHRPVEATTIDAAKAHVAGLDDEQWRADLARLEARSKGGVRIGRLAAAGAIGPVATADRGEALELEHRRLGRRIRRPWFRASYSDLTPSTGRSAPFFDDETDRDHVDLQDATATAASAATSAFAGADHPVPLREFDAGKQPGNFFHKVFEDLDFRDRDRDRLEQLVAERLRRYGFSAADWTGPLSDAVTSVLGTVIDPRTGLRLGDLPLDRRLNELRFALPVAGGVGGAGRPVTPTRLAEIFAAAGNERLVRYSRQLEQLEFGAFRGFLTGVIDLVFEHEGRWYVLDYKSNLLGPRFGDYAADRLWEPMGSHHYILQYHLYVLALHRYLTYRVEGYELERHFGGVYYLFLRGLSERTGSACGVFADRPDSRLVEALEQLFDGRGGAR